MAGVISFIVVGAAVSFFDPAGMVHRLQLGRIATSIAAMREALRGMLDVDVSNDVIVSA